MKTRKDYSEIEMEMIIDHCQPQYCSWVVEWMEQNNESEINEYNVFEYLNDNIDDVDYYVESNILDEYLEDLKISK